VVSDRHPRFRALAGAAAAAALGGAASGCAWAPVQAAHGQFASRAPVAVAHGAESTAAEITAAIAHLNSALDRTPSFDPDRRAAEPALVALAARIAATLGEEAAARAPDLTVAVDGPGMTLAALAAPPAALVDPGHGPWGLEFGQFDDPAMAKDVWSQIALAAPDAARGLSPRVASLAGGVVLRAGPVDDKDAAIALCAKFAETGATCAPSRFVGKSVAETGQ